MSSTLEKEKAEIESERTRIRALDAQVENMARELDRDRLKIRNSNWSDWVAVDAFNAKFGQYTALAQKSKTAFAAFNERVDKYNAKLQK